MGADVKVTLEIEANIPDGAPEQVVCKLDEEFLGELPDDDGDGGFKSPIAIAFDSQERLYVTDEAKHRVTVLDKTGQVLGAWGVHCSADCEIDGPSGRRPPARLSDPNDLVLRVHPDRF